MASKKKESEGIALLSMYNDEDDEMEDLEKQEQEEEESNELWQRQDIQEEWREERYAEVSVVEEYSVVNRVEMVSGGSTNDATPPVFGENSTPEKMKFGSLTSHPRRFIISSSHLQQQTIQLDTDRVKARGTLAIVEYGHDEAAMSPEVEEKETEETGRVVLAEELQPTSGKHKVHQEMKHYGDFMDEMSVDIVQNLSPSNQAISPQSSQPSRSGSMNCPATERESAQADQTVTLEQKDVDPLDKFLPPPPKVKCSEDLQRKINKFLEYKKAGKSFNAEVRNRKDYRNPDFLLHAVRYQDIDQIGSCFDKDVFDPHGYDKSDYYLEIEADMKREMERKEQERKKSPKVEFVSGGTPLGPATKVNIPIPGIAPLPATDAIPRDGRQNKKSKWDKVDGDQRKPLASGMQDMSGVGAHAALLSAANAGAGYMAFAQQKRWEAEERRSSERKLERRS